MPDKPIEAEDLAKRGWHFNDVELVSIVSATKRIARS